MSRRRRAVTLVEVLGALAVGTVLLTLLGKIVVDAIRFQHRAVAHADRVAIMDTLGRRLHDDLLAATACAFKDGQLTVTRLADAGRLDVKYAIGPDLVRRTANDDQESEWRAPGLTYECVVARGPRGAILTVRFIEQPPPHTPLPVRTYPATFVLPIPAHVGHAEGQP